ncbi:MAG: Coenzyme F420 hydrogenase/dehydrogenase, beta subunit C-terminal domain [Clostridia bacterium]|nr:Coenzyme F420 hydrogenase/dehydrogenase, beta subunit C-terminal domain [Clostridia bacterium]
MTSDTEGFLYPQIYKEKCVDCGVCEKACQSTNPLISTNEFEAYACVNNDENVLSQSSSGGVFTLLAVQILKLRGVVFGAAFDDSFVVRHICVENVDDLQKLRGSKYVQSDIGTAYRDAEKFLKEDRYVLFTGTPCQIDGLLHYLKKPYERLYTQDVICHGTPSPLVWDKYVSYREKKASSKVSRVSFRHKKLGWKDYSVLFDFANGTCYEQNHTKDIFFQGFLANLFLRPSCHNCFFKSINRNSDITLADFWGVEKTLPEMFDERGVSLVLVNSRKGRELLELIKEQIRYQPVDSQIALRHNPSVYRSAKPSKNRHEFFSRISGDSSIDTLIEKYTKVSLLDKLVLKFKIFVLKMLKRLRIR